jgi:hypothetical protein
LTKRLLYLILLLGFTSLQLNAQSDTTKVDPNFIEHSPKKASLLSAILPGAGQVYNKKYWKVPLVYGAIGASLYFALDQKKQFEEFKDAYLYRVDDDPNTNDDKYTGIYTDQNLLTLIENRRRNRDLMFVLTGFSYMLNIVDAAVDAHLYYFDVSDDLQASFRPKLLYNPYNQHYTTGVQLNIKFKR